MPVSVAATALVTLVSAWLSDSGQRGGAPATWGLTDTQLWDRIVSGQDPLAGMSIAQAVKLDPRRVDAAIRQAIWQGMSRRMGNDSQSNELNRALYCMGLDAVRAAGDGKVNTMPLVSVHEENWWRMLGGTSATWPSFVRRQMLDDWTSVAGGFERARQVAREAELAAAGQALPDAREWVAMQEVLSDMQNGLRVVLETGVVPEIPERVQARALLPGPVREGYGVLYARGAAAPPPGSVTGSARVGFRGYRVR